MLVPEEETPVRVDGYVDVRPAVVVKIIRHSGERWPRPRLQNAGLFRDIRKAAISVVVVQDVRAAREPLRTARHCHALPLTVPSLAGQGHVIDVQLDIVAHKKVQKTVEVII